VQGTASGGKVDTSGFKKDGPYKIGFSNIDVSNTWRVQMVYELDAEAERQGIELIKADAGGDINKQISDIQDLLAQDIDALLVAPNSPTATNAVTKKAIQSGIPVITFSSSVEGDDAYTAYIGVDDYSFGKASSEFILDAIGGKGKVIVLSGMAGNQITADRTQAWEDALAALPDKGENVEVLAEYFTDWDYAKGKQAMETALAAYPEFDAVFSHGGAVAQGAIEAMQAAGHELVPITGETNNGFLKLWKEMKPDGFESVGPGYPSWISGEALRTALKCLNGEEVDKNFILESVIVTQDTVDDYARTDLSDSYWGMSALPESMLQELYGEGSGNK
jgi:ribose transport system substrate-binding protein